MADNRLNLVVQFTALDGLSGSLKSMIGLGKTGKQEIKGLTDELAKVKSEIRRYDDELKVATGSVNHLWNAQKKLLEQEDQLRSRIAQRQRLMAIDGRTAAIQRRADAYQREGMHGLLGAAVFLAPMKAMIDEGQSYERELARIEALGLGKNVVQHADKYARAAHIVGNSTRDMAHAYGDAMAIFKNTHEADFVAPFIAKMKFANQALYGEGEGGQHDQALMSLMKTIEFRGGTKSESAFSQQAEYAQKVVNASRGRVDGNEMLNAMKTGGILAKTMSDKAFYLNSEPLVQEYGGNRFGTALSALYSNIAQGHGSMASQQELLRLGLLDRSKVEFNKLGMLKKTLPGAADISVLREDGALAYLNKVLLPAFAKKGITGDSAIIDELGRIFSNKGASSLMTSVYQQREKLAMQSAANERALGIDGSVKVAGNSFAGKSVDMKAKWHSFLEVAAKKGGLMDMAIAGVGKLTSALETLTNFGNKHPTAFRWLGTAVMALVGMRLATAGAKLAFGGMLGPVGKLWGLFSKYRELGSIAALFPRLAKGASAIRSLGSASVRAGGKLASLGAKAATAGLRVSAAGLRWTGMAARIVVSKIASAASVLSAIGRAALFMGQNMLRAGLMMLANPLVLTIMAIVAAVGLIVYAFKNWSSITEKVTSTWNNLKNSLGSTAIGKFFGLGQNVADGVAKGIQQNSGKPVAAVNAMANNVGGHFANKMQIRSPSRLFMAFGGHIADGLALGMDHNSHRPLASMRRMATAVAGAGALAMAPAAHARAGAAGARAPLKIEIHIHQQPGEDAQALAQKVMAAIDNAHRSKRLGSYEDDF